MDADTQVLIQQWRLHRFRVRLLRLLVVFVLFLAALGALYPFYQFTWKATNSIEGHLFLLDKTSRPVKGELAGFWAPINPLYPKEMWFTKYIVGQEGDVVTHKGREVFINGKSYGIALDRASNGRPLPMSAEGVIPRGYYFMWTPHPRSFDSRYSFVGLVKDEQIRGRSFRLL